jgi:hypothetical protein
MPDFEAVDYFTDRALFADPYGYLAHLRAQVPSPASPITRS